MIALLAVSGIGVAIIVGLAMLLPCKACQARRERMRAALARWRETHPGQKN
jgi:hypothetical protein